MGEQMQAAGGWCAPPDWMCGCGRPWRDCGGRCVPVDGGDPLDLPTVTVIRGGVDFNDPVGRGLIAGAAPPADVCGGNHRWERVPGHRSICECATCGTQPAPRALECADCCVTLAEDAPGFDAMWEAAPWW